MAVNLITDKMIALEMACALSHSPPHLRGADPFYARAAISLAPDDRALSLECFRPKLIDPAVEFLLGHKHPPLGRPLSVPPGADGHVCAFNRSQIRVLRCYNLRLGQSQILIDVEYEPPVPDYGIPLYQWLGADAEFA